MQLLLLEIASDKDSLKPNISAMAIVMMPIRALVIITLISVVSVSIRVEGLGWSHDVVV
jgi:hypothetical protein